MTDLLIDLASYQEGIDLAKVKAAGFTKVNVKLSQGNWYQWSRAGEYIAKARDLGLGICTFHWLDNSSSGAEQARIVLGLMRRYGVIDGAAHQCDCEDSARPASWAIWRDYMSAMQDGLQRHVVNYTGDWWWPQHMGNRGAEVTPYLWAAPNDGYLGSYAGVTSGHWRAGYGGWGDYSMLQYAVQPIAGAGGGDLSKTAIRDPAVWAALTGGQTTMGLREDPDGIYEIFRVEAVANMLDSYSSGPEKGTAVPLTATLKESLTHVRKIDVLGNRLDTLLERTAQPAVTGQPAQEQVNAGVLAAMLDPRVQKGIGDAIASHFKVV